MVAYKEVSENLAVAGQIFISQLEVLKERGFEVIICNRPDYEDDVEDQPLAAQMESRAAELGLKFVYIPVSGTPTLQAAKSTKEVLDAAEGKVLAYCLSGMRSIMLCSLAHALEGNVKSDDLIQNAKTLGYNLSGLRPAFESMAA